MATSSLLLLAGFFFITGAAVVGIIWYLQGVARKISPDSKNDSTTDPKLAEVVRLLRDTQTQDMIVRIDGKDVKAVNELSPAQHHRLNFVSGVLAKWLVQSVPEASTAPEEHSSTSVESTVPEQQPSTTPTQGSLYGEDWIPAETVLLEPKTSYVPPFEDETAANVKPVSTNLPDIVGGVLNPAPQPAPVFKSIATQINDILQERMVGTPFAARGITVSDGPDHGVLVTLDGIKYEGVKDVPDEDVRSIIRSAVVEWEKVGNPGRSKP
jgi:hypothetical protein